MRLTKRDVLRIAKNESALARAFKISPAAIHQWPVDGPIPLLREMQLRHDIAPWAFSKNGKLKVKVAQKLA